jgi:threonine synthase
MVSALRGIGRDEIDRLERSHWRYAAALPIPMKHRVSLGEGCTPLLPARVGGLDVYVKTEWFNPTGSFKDRGTSVMVSMLQQQGVERILEDSSGNGGSSVAAYSAAARMRAKILVPEGTSSTKILQSRILGAEIEIVRGTREETAAEAVRQSSEIFYSSHNWHPFFLQGTKLIAYELWEDLGFSSPDNVVVPVGAGSLVLGLWLGFNELFDAGQITRIPRILGAQPDLCSPLAKAFSLGLREAVDGAWQKTIAEGTSISRPVRDREVLAAVSASNGGFQTVSEDEIISATRALVAQGLYTEPTSAMTAAAVPGLVEQKLLSGDETTVLVLTGSGLKAAESMSKILS